MTVAQLMPWIGGPVKFFEAAFSPLICPIDDTVASHVIESDAKVVDAAVKHAHAAFLKHQDATTAKRVEWLLAAAEAIDKIEGELVRSLIRFIGKPSAPPPSRPSAWAPSSALAPRRSRISWARCCRLMPPRPEPAASASPRASPMARRRRGDAVQRPANLLIQKVAPALAVGNAVVVKPSPPGTEVALLIAEAVKTAGVPDGLFNVVPGGRESAKLLAAHPLVAVVTVTGSTAAGNELARAAGAKKFVGELGSNAANIVCADADLADAATRIAGAAFEASGQQCISAQRVIVERPVFDRFLELFVAAARKLKVGDPEDAATDVGPMVSAAAADRVEQMVADAVAKGARLVLEPARRGAILGPAIVADAPDEARLMREEAFGPVVVVQSVADVDAALALANSSSSACRAPASPRRSKPRSRSRASCVGSLWINDASRFRLDSYPFGGVGASGFGAKACATPWRSSRSGSSPACGSIRNDSGRPHRLRGMAQDVVARRCGRARERRVNRRRARPRGPRGEARARFAGIEIVEALDDLIALGPALVAEVAGQAAVAEHGEAVLRGGIDCLVISVGALADPALLARLKAAAQSGHGRILLPAGAIGGLDAIAAMRVAGLTSVRYRSRKPAAARQPRGAGGRSRRAHAADRALQGIAGEAALLYPQNANVAAAVALAGLGFDATEVELVADPGAPGNVHEIEAEGAAGRFTIQLQGKPSRTNPKTSALAALSVARALLNRQATIVI